MTKEQYIKTMKEIEEWAPGWMAIEEEFDSLYPGQEPTYYDTTIESRVMFGGIEFLEGFSIYDMGNGCYHIVTFGMSQLYPDEEAFGGEYSRWGYEMTMKLKADSADDCLWALDMMSNLARYTYTSKHWFDPYECIHGDTPLHEGTDTRLTSVVTVADTSAHTLDTVHGKVGFIQLVGITEEEYQAIQEDRENIHKLIDLMKKDNPELIMDMDRTESYF